MEFIALVTSIPYEDHILLSNLLILGKDDYSDLYNSECKIYDSSNKPNSTQQSKKKSRTWNLSSAFVTTLLWYLSDTPKLPKTPGKTLPIQFKPTTKALVICSDCNVEKAYQTMWKTIELEILCGLKEIKGFIGVQTLYIIGISLRGSLPVISCIVITRQESSKASILSLQRCQSGQ